MERLLELEDVAHIGAAQPVDAVVDEHAVGDVVVRRVDLEVVHGPVVLLELDRVDGSLDELAVDLDQHRHARMEMSERRES